MNLYEMHREFKFLLDKMDSIQYPNFEPEEIDLLLNKGQERYIKQRYGINNIKRQSFEETQKRTEDLKEIIKQFVTFPTANSGIINLGNNITTNSVFCQLPTDHWFIIWERAIISDPDCSESNITIRTNDTYEIQCEGCPTCNPENCPDSQITVTIPGTNVTVVGKYAEVRPIQHLEVSKVLNDPFKGPDYEKILRIMYENNVELLPAQGHTVRAYMMRYIKKPVQMDILATPVVNCELSEHTHQEIVDEAVKLALEGIEAKRTQTFTPIVDNQKE